MDDVSIPIGQDIFVHIKHNRIVIGDVVFIQLSGFWCGCDAVAIAIVRLVGDGVDSLNGFLRFHNRYFFISIGRVITFRWKE